MKNRVGDTLIEVTLAVGIFSMVAIAVVAVMNGGTSSAQTALETTLAREEVDTQAEALRFIHSAYLAEMDSGTGTDSDGNSNNGYVGKWKKITDKAITGSNDEFKAIIANNTSCGNVYNDDFFKEHAFAINPDNMEVLSNSNESGGESTQLPLGPAVTYPRLFKNELQESLYSGNNSQNEQEEESQGTQGNFQAQGVYVLAVKDQKTNTATDINNDYGSFDSNSAFYDFYIRTCWYGAGDEVSSSISTIVRLYDPAGTSSSFANNVVVTIEFHSNGGETEDHETTYEQLIKKNEPNKKLDPNRFKKSDDNGNELGFDGWSLSPDGKEQYKNEAPYIVPENLTGNMRQHLYALWHYDYTRITFINGNGVDVQMAYQMIEGDDDEKGNLYPIQNIFNPPDNKEFDGWCRKQVDSKEDCPNGEYFEDGAEFYGGRGPVTLYALWKEIPSITITYDSNGDNGDKKTEIAKQGVKYTIWGGNSFTNPGKDLVSWNTRKDGKGNSYSPGEERAFNSDITLYAQWGDYYMQNFTKEKCRNLASSKVFTIIDQRAKNNNGYSQYDNGEYNVKYVKEMCWMTQDLRIKGEITANGSNFNGKLKVEKKLNNNNIFPFYSDNYSDTTEAPYYENDENSSIYYNYCSARANYECKKALTQESEYDLCPKGWGLPTVDDFKSTEGLLEFNQNGLLQISLNSSGKNKKIYFYSNEHKLEKMMLYWTSTNNEENSTLPLIAKRSNKNKDFESVQSTDKTIYLRIRCVLK